MRPGCPFRANGPDFKSTVNSGVLLICDVAAFAFSSAFFPD